jgi:MYXO-CTERM domain-containing protein
MQWLQCPANIAAQKALGINTFMGDGCGGSPSAFLDTCAAQGVYGVMDSGNTSVKSHAALLGWVFGDEPDLESNKVEPATLLTAYNTLKGSDPNHITFMTLTSGFYSEDSPPAWMNNDRSRYAAYCQATDAVGFDIYPVYGWCRPDWLYKVGAAQTELGAISQGKVAYQWIEAVKTSGQWCDIAARGADDGPYPEEIRNEVWQALVHGATAIGYFTHSWECPGYSQFCLSTAQETELTRTNGQVTKLTGPLLAAAHTGGVTIAAEAGTSVSAMARDFGGKAYVFVVNTARTTTEVTITVPGVSGATAQVYDESRAIPLLNGKITDSFGPLGVHIYVLDYVAATDGGLPSDTSVGAGGMANADGSVGAGGTTNAGGSVGAGGTARSDAAAGTGGTTNAGGSVSAGADGAAASPAGSEPSGEQGGCGCRAARQGTSHGATFALLALALSGLARRRRTGTAS